MADSGRSDVRPDRPVLASAPRLRRRPRRLAAALGRRRRLRVGIVQLVCVAAAVVLGLVVPRISLGASVPANRTTEMLVAVGAGFVPFIGIVYSMLFLVVQFGATTYTPRLNLFRDDPIVWRAFSFFTGVIVFAFTAVFEIGAKSDTSVLVLIILGLAVLVAITLMRALQNAAFKSIQLASILDQLGRRGREVIDGVHPQPVPASDRGDVTPDTEFLSRRDARRRPRRAVAGALDGAPVGRCASSVACGRAQRCSYSSLGRPWHDDL